MEGLTCSAELEEMRRDRLKDGSSAWRFILSGFVIKQWGGMLGKQADDAERNVMNEPMRADVGCLWAETGFLVFLSHAGIHAAKNICFMKLLKDKSAPEHKFKLKMLILGCFEHF